MDYKFDEASDIVLNFLDGVDWDRVGMKEEARRLSILTEELKDANSKNLSFDEIGMKLDESTVLMNKLAIHLVALAEKKMKALKTKLDKR
jgi:hypothetical protein